jgi:hypothetical protein
LLVRSVVAGGFGLLGGLILAAGILSRTHGAIVLDLIEQTMRAFAKTPYALFAIFAGLIALLAIGALTIMYGLREDERRENRRHRLPV